MLLEFIVFGAWFATLGLVHATHHLNAIIGKAYLLSAIAAILSPLLLGAIGDRYLAPRTLLGLSHLVGACVLLAVPHAIATHNSALTLGLIFAYMIGFQPTLGLVNTVALSTLKDNRAVFPYVRVFASIGWVVAGLAVGAVGYSASTAVFYVAAVTSVVLGLYAFSLPAGQVRVQFARLSFGDLIGIHAFVLFRERSFTVLMICALMTSISLGIYNSFASPYLAVLGIRDVAGVLALGQISEVAFIITIPWVLKRIGMKWALLCGMAMWGVRFLLFIDAARGAVASAIVGVLLHGICADYFIVIAAMYIAEIASRNLAAQAQNWLILVVSGFGQAIGSGVAGAVYSSTIMPRAHLGPQAWTQLWLVPVVLATATTIVWVLFFRPAPGTTVAAGHTA